MLIGRALAITAGLSVVGFVACTLSQEGVPGDTENTISSATSASHGSSASTGGGASSSASASGTGGAGGLGGAGGAAGATSSMSATTGTGGAGGCYDGIVECDVDKGCNAITDCIAPVAGAIAYGQLANGMGMCPVAGVQPEQLNSCNCADCAVMDPGGCAVNIFLYGDPACSNSIINDIGAGCRLDAVAPLGTVGAKAQIVQTANPACAPPVPPPVAVAVACTTAPGTCSNGKICVPKGANCVELAGAQAACPAGYMPKARGFAPQVLSSCSGCGCTAVASCTGSLMAQVSQTATCMAPAYDLPIDGLCHDTGFTTVASVKLPMETGVATCPGALMPEPQGGSTICCK